MIVEEISGNLFFRHHQMKKGDVIEGHEHNFDHTSIVFEGCVHVVGQTPDGRTVEVTLPYTEDGKTVRHCLIDRQVKHRIEALEDSHFVCAYSHHTPQGEVTQVCTGWHGAYV
jgi:quercetin dioxygenase-like cupin family protein